jgi:hypothetical protein
METVVNFGNDKMFRIAMFLMDFVSTDCCMNMQRHVDEVSANTLELWDDPERYVKQIRIDRDF